jgi:hypothetical protein
MAQTVWAVFGLNHHSQRLVTAENARTFKHDCFDRDQERKVTK